MHCLGRASRSERSDIVSPSERALELPEHYFRREFSTLVSVLARRFGVHRVELCEDAAQTALLRALQHWPHEGQPKDPNAWLYRVAFNEVLGALRREKRVEPSSDAVEEIPAERGPGDEARLEHEV